MNTQFEFSFSTLQNEALTRNPFEMKNNYSSTYCEVSTTPKKVEEEITPIEPEVSVKDTPKKVEEEITPIEPEVSIKDTPKKVEEEITPIEPEVSVKDTPKKVEEEITPIEPEVSVKDTPKKVEEIKQKSFLIILCNNNMNDQINNALDENSSLYDICVINAESIGSKDIQSKWECIQWYFNENEDWKTYEYIWTPNNNLSISKTDVSDFLAKSKTDNIDITQPSISKDDNSKIYIHPSLLHKEHFNDIPTSFIENKMPCFKVSFVVNYLQPFLKSNKLFLKSGWGIDVWWSNISKNKRLINSIAIKEIIDSTSKNDTLIGKKEMKYYMKKYKLKLSILR